MSASYVLQRAASSGVDVAVVLEQLALPPDYIVTASDRVLTDDFPRLAMCVVRHANDDLFGFRAGENIHPCGLGPIGLAANHAATMKESIDVLACHAFAHVDWIRVETEQLEKTIRWTLHLDAIFGDAVAHHLVDGWASSIVTFGRLMVGDSFRAQSITLTRQASMHAERFEKYYRCNVRFAAKYNRVEVLLSDLTAKSRLNDPKLFEQHMFAVDTILTDRGYQADDG